ncbi:uncharacterized protein LOC124437787 isoform X1 [Xenia sp. Carnegie-2017]|uniref:uncharacterized protein LOC124437787 isoform X1 n=1 Tax=Xenia sp. Carnegie-2017 TaxID=2897299 RepID=UPI001F033AB0|nr:uncharacterized protein LOC124437787 isoform X1 [Xenia sp. Carnegie-2017]
MGSLYSKTGSNVGLNKKEDNLINKTQKYLRTNGLDWSFYKDQVNKWKKLELNIALAGSNQSEKASFIKSIIGPKAHKDGNEKPFAYSYRKSENIKLWDLPGFGTPEAPEDPNIETYCENIGGLEKYDTFFIFCTPNFTNCERKLVDDLKKSSKPFDFICTYNDADVQNAKKDEDERHDEESDIELTVRKYFLKKLKNVMTDKTDLHLIDTKEKNDFRREHDDVFKKFLERRQKLFLHYFNDEFHKNSRYSKVNATKNEGDPDEIYEDLIQSWKNVQIHLAITGNSGTGKSSFINAVRGIKAYEEGAAEVGVTEMTSKVTKYSHPDNDNIAFWDLPGIGTPTYPNLKDYCRKVGGLEKYDAFLIFCKTRFTSHDKELAEKVSSELKKPFFFIRTNVDYDVKNAKEDEGENIDEESVLERMRKDCLQNLKDLIDDKNDIYMIDNKAQDGYDFQRLKESIAEALPDEKKKHFADSLAIVTHAIIKLQANLLREQTLVVTKALSYDPATSKPQMSTSDLDLAREVISRKLIPRLYNALNVPKEKSDEIKQQLLIDESIKSMKGLPLEVIFYVLTLYIDRLEEYALQ